MFNLKNGSLKLKIDNEQIKSITEKLNFFSTFKINRYSTIPLPIYRHIPGLTPHPIADPRGHSYGKHSQNVTRVSEENWKTNKDYLYSVDLFNFKYYWECHEHLEDLWKIEQDLNLKKFLQGIIQVSAAYIKWIQGVEEGMKKLHTKGLIKMKEVIISSPRLLGIDIAEFIEKNELFFNSQNKINSVPPTMELQGL